jgi:hypothetical protein
MQLDFAFLCDAATEHGGKLNALGLGIDRLNAGRLPAVHGRLMLVSRFSYGASDVGSRPFTIRITDADGREVGRTVQGEMNLQLGEGTTTARANLLVDLVNLEFTTYGPHEVVVLINGDEMVNLPLEVARP